MGGLTSGGRTLHFLRTIARNGTVTSRAPQRHETLRQAVSCIRLSVEPSALGSTGAPLPRACRRFRQGSLLMTKRRSSPPVHGGAVEHYSAQEGGPWHSMRSRTGTDNCHLHPLAKALNRMARVVTSADWSAWAGAVGLPNHGKGLVPRAVLPRRIWPRACKRLGEDLES